MKSRVRQKLNSRRGASFLLALLFFLICALVSSTVLMAAAANAGRSRSEREEHQRYLTLSSAVRLLCDELTDCQYRGQYRYWEKEITETDEDTGETTVVGLNRYLKQEEGLYQYKDGSGNARLSALLNDFDYLFSREFDEVKFSRPNITVTKLNGLSPPPTRTLTLTPESGVDGLNQPVTVELMVELASPYVINLTASLGEYAIRATLTTDASRPGLPDSFSEDIHQTAPMTWKVGWIRPADSEGGASNG